MVKRSGPGKQIGLPGPVPAPIVAVRLTREAYDRVSAIGEETNDPPSTVIARAVEAWLSEHDNDGLGPLWAAFDREASGVDQA